MFHTPKEKGLTIKQVYEICERLLNEAKERSGKCPDCGVKPEHQHKEGCDVAVCTSCKGQRLACDCKNGEPDMWTGLWPGTKECYEKKLICFVDHMGSGEWMFDLNTLAKIKK